MFYAPHIRSAVFAPLWRGHHGNTGSVDGFFDAAFDNALADKRALPNFEQDEQAYRVSLDVPGLAKAQLHVEIEGAVLRIRSQDDAPRSLRLAYELPGEIDASASEAKLENGVLSLRLAKLQLAPKAQVLSVG